MSTILIADDSSFMRGWLKGILKEHGYTDIIEAENGQVAFEKYSQQKPDLVFLDITMPVLDGLGALEKIKTIHPEAKIIMCSSMSTQSNIITALNQGATDFITKPYFHNLKLIVDKALKEDIQ